MTLRERAILATQARQRQAEARAERVCALVRDGVPAMFAARRVGVSRRTANRYRQMAGL